MTEPKPTELTHTHQFLMDTSIFRHLSEEQQNNTILELVESHNDYANDVFNYDTYLKLQQP